MHCVQCGRHFGTQALELEYCEGRMRNEPEGGWCRYVCQRTQALKVLANKRTDPSEKDTATSDPWITLVPVLPWSLLHTAPLHKRKRSLKPDCLCVSAFIWLWRQPVKEQPESRTKAWRVCVCARARSVLETFQKTFAFGGMQTHLCTDAVRGLTRHRSHRLSPSVNNRQPSIRTFYSSLRYCVAL